MSVAAHLIVGRREEPFLPALLQSLVGVADTLVVNENSGERDGINARVLAQSTFAQRGRMFVDSAPFEDFAAARNRVLALHRQHAAGDWAAFVDADEVHRDIARTIASNLDRLPRQIAVVDGYTRHYFQSFDWYTTIERRMAFFRVTPEVYWLNAVHEKLAGVAGAVLAIPYVYDHYGWVLPMERQAEKGRQYASLGQAGETYDEETVAAVDPDYFFRTLRPLALRYHGDHSAAVEPVRRALEERATAQGAHAAIRRVQSTRVRAANVVRRLNFEYRWRGRYLDPRVRQLFARAASSGNSECT